MNKMRCYIRWSVLYLISLLPLRFLYLISDITAFVLHYIVRYRYSVIFVNLSRSFPFLKYNELRAIAKEYYIYMCDIMVESIWAISANQEQMCKVVKVVNKEVIEDYASRYNKVLTVMGHMGNWELIGAIFGESSKRIDNNFYNGTFILAYKQAEKPVSEMLFKKMRMVEFKKFEKKGEVIESNRIVRHMLKCGNEKVLYTFIADQSPIYGKDKVLIKFLNQPTFMISGPEYVARKLNLPVLFLNMSRVSRGKYEVSFIPLSDLSADSKPGEITKSYGRELEKAIENNKYNWLWSHKRWKRELNEQERELFNKEYN